MNESKHTPEPWKAVIRYNGDAWSIRVGRTNIATIVATNGLPRAEKTANARRIVECVNGCEGIADPSAVNDLLAAIKEVRRLDRPSGSGRLISDVEAAYVALDAAIASAEGK